MMGDLDSMHDKLLEAYTEIMLLQGIDLEKLAVESGESVQPTGHLKI